MNLLKFILWPYHWLWTLFMLATLPFVLAGNDRRRRKRAGLDIPREPLGREAIWIHALSMGEVVSALPLVKTVKRQFPHQDLVFTVATRQGMQVALKELEKEANLIEYMPLDFWWAVRRLIHHIRPAIFILVETDLWPGLIYSLKKNKTRTMLVNGRVSPRTYKAYYRARFLIRRLWNQFDLILTQTHLDQARLLQLGIAADKVRNNGNIKFDRPWQVPDTAVIQDLKKQFGLSLSDPVWVAGSTHADEESTILDVFIRLRRQFSDLRLIVAPRRIERIAELQQLVLARNLKPVLKTDFTPGSLPYDVLLLNTIGELEKFYALADITFVGGSLVPIGGHNLLEPAGFGKPVLFGPYTHNFEVMAETLLAAGGGERVHSPDELYEILVKLLADPARSAEMGTKAQNFIKENSGALTRTIAHMENLLAAGKE